MLGTIGLIGVQVNAVPATRRLPAALVGVLGFVAYFAIYALPLALAAWLVYRRQWRRLGEAVATALVVVGVVALANFVLRLEPFRLLYDGLAASPSNGVRPVLFDGYLAGLVAFITVIGLAGRPRWRAAFWSAIGFYSLTRLAGNADHPPERPDHAADRVLDRVRPAVRGRLGVRAPVRPADRRRPVRRRRADRRHLPDLGHRAGEPPVPGPDGRRRGARGHRLRPGPAGRRPAVPDLPPGPGQRAGIAQRAVHHGAGDRAQRAADLLGRGRRGGHAPAAGRAAGRLRGRRAELRADDRHRRWTPCPPRPPTTSWPASGTPCSSCTSGGSPTGR